ncbi:MULTISPECIES: L,D-transpeptidase family protein [unclassified Devosia]|uniref:L,D-transpeptidase family protein n=1 Tax=unclassified Devosia TaxID=196773 RepID=UPI000A8DDFD4|nr:MULTISPECIES: L,D-transpeptidase family protein [unclassified Devosia]MBN9306056.1 L,D-transpeptidase family protein [Devosia sp.]
MRALMALLLAGVTLSGAAHPALAEAAADTQAVVEKAALVVIAPPRSDIARIIKAGLQKAYYAAKPDTRAYSQAQKLYFFYGARGFEPLWLTTGADGSATFSPNAEKIIAVFKHAQFEGLRPSDYLSPALDPAAAGTDPAKLAALETAFSAATLNYAQDSYGGRINPTDVNVLLTIAPKKLDAADTLTKLAASNDPAKFLLSLDPPHPEFKLLKAALAKFYDKDAVKTETITIPDGPTLKLGMKDERVPTLRERLAVPAPEIPEGATDAKVDTTYDKPLMEAVKAFQAGLGLTADGVMGPATVAALNGAGTVSKDDIIANMERWRWEPNDLGAFHVEVNIPQFTVWIVKDGEPVHSTRVVVGRPTNMTPVFSDEIEDIVVNPYWNVPPSIATNEIKPHLIANPGYLDSQNMEMLAGGKVVNASAIDWTTTNINNYHIRQKPGGANALGQIKFLFPNDLDIYLHDTPSKSLFARAYRAYSHGCVRVQNPMDFAGALLATNPDLSEDKLKAMFGDKEKWVPLKHHIPVHLMYFTLRADPDGTIRSYGDVYGHNKKLIELMNA